MAIIIPFPNRTASALDLALGNLENTLSKAGLNPEQRSAALAELRPTLEPIFEQLAFSVEIPDQVDLTDTQVGAIELSIRHAFNELASAYSRNLGYAAAVIAGLVARQQLEPK